MNKHLIRTLLNFCLQNGIRRIYRDHEVEFTHLIAHNSLELDPIAHSVRSLVIRLHRNENRASLNPAYPNKRHKFSISMINRITDIQNRF